VEERRARNGLPILRQIRQPSRLKPARSPHGRPVSPDAALHRRSSAGHFLGEPVREAGLENSGAAAGGALVEHGPEVPCLGVCDDAARVIAGGEFGANEFVESKLLGAGNLDDPVDWRTERRARDRGGDVGGGPDTLTNSSNWVARTGWLDGSA
jgi:hypothetical protein